MTTPTIINASSLAPIAPEHAIAAMRDVFESLARGRVIQPPQSVFPLENGGDVISYPAVMLDDGLISIKISPYIPQSVGARVTAWTLLLDTATGDPVALVDSLALTTVRTAATTALAVDLLAVPHAESLAIVGSGRAALAHFAHLRCVRPFSTIRLYSRRPLEIDLPGVEVVHCLAPVVECDVIALCTSAAEPVIDVTGVGQGSLITSISTNAPGAHEIDPALLGGLDVYCDSLLSAGTVHEFSAAAASGEWSLGNIRGDLATLLLGDAVPPSRQRPAFFRSIGQGVEDAAIARLAMLA